MTTPGSTDIPAVEHTALPDSTPLLDVREPDEWNRGHAPQAIHIPLGELPNRMDELPTTRPLYVTCRSGGRSGRAVAFLRSAGVDAVNMSGGMLGWQTAGRPLSTGDGVGAPRVE